jgi:hypothetical protein
LKVSGTLNGAPSTAEPDAALRATEGVRSKVPDTFNGRLNGPFLGTQPLRRQ